MRDAVTTALELVGLAVMCAAAFLAAPLWGGLLACGAALLLVGAMEGRR